MNELEQQVRSHYARRGLLRAILDGAARAGGRGGELTPDLLAPVDEFHTAGQLSTLKALALIPLQAGMRVLDAGCGIGGTARHLASEHGCRVTGIDLTPDYIDTARQLTARMGLEHRCRFDQGSVVDLPYRPASFDAAVSFHVAMNVEPRGRFYAELARVLCPGAPLCLFDVMKGPAPDMRYPVPWAESPAISFLHSRVETARLLEEAGFAVTREENLREFARDYFRQLFDRSETEPGPPPLGLHLLTGSNTAEKFRNYAEALEAHQIEPIIMVAERAD